MNVLKVTSEPGDRPSMKVNVSKVFGIFVVRVSPVVECASRVDCCNEVGGRTTLLPQQSRSNGSHTGN